MQEKIVSGFSKLSKLGKIRWVAENFFTAPRQVVEELISFWHKDEEQQKVLDGFSENTLSNYYLPFGVAPNFIINGNVYTIPMVIEESSVVAAASSAAKFWMSRGGFKAKVIATQKLGQVHFSWAGDINLLKAHFETLEKTLRDDATPITSNMEKRGGGITDIQLLDLSHLEANYYQLMVAFETCDSMGANFINSVLEEFGHTLKRFIRTHEAFNAQNEEPEIIMAILSNYTPNCIVRAWVECPIEVLGEVCDGISAQEFAEKFAKAVRIAHIDPHRATTHNKGIFNGVDAVVLATGNDFRAIEACGHTYASRDGQYRSLSNCLLEKGMFKFWIDLPLAVGTVGGLTKLHPIAKRSLELLGQPGATTLMEIIATTGLAQNFAAVRSLVTTGIQKGHMKMHLKNILNHLQANDQEAQSVMAHFESRVVSFTAVRTYLEFMRTGKPAFDKI